MTSLKVIEDQIKQFLGTDEPEVIAIRGTWGSGKTYFWNSYLLDTCNHNKVALDHYSYVSLFGISSIEALKFSIYEKMKKRKLIGQPLSFKTFGENGRAMLSAFGKRASAVVKDNTFFKGRLERFGLSDVVIRSIAYRSVNKTIICLDDFERMRLDAQEVLGLISELKEEKACKIVLIFNDEELSDDAKEKYNTLREKVIDKEFLFSPTPEECAEIVFGKADDQDDYTEILKERCCKLGIKNIRIIRKIQKFSGQLNPFLEGAEPETKYQALSSLVLNAYCFYTKSDDVPDFEFIKGWNTYNFTETGARAQEKEDETRKQKLLLWERNLRAYGAFFFDYLEIEIMRSVERGYFVDEEIKEEVDYLNGTIKKRKTDRENKALNLSYEAAWDLYFNSFDDNAKEIVQVIHEATKYYIDRLSQLNLNNLVLLLRELGEDEIADSLIDLVISRRNEANYFNLNQKQFGDRNWDPKISDRFAEVYNQRRDRKSPVEVLNKITFSKECDPEDEEQLAALTVDDYVNLFKSDAIKGEGLDYKIERCLDFGRYEQPSERHKLIATNAISALRSIASESKLNEVRMRRFGIWKRKK